MVLSVKQIAEKIDAAVVGDPSLEISGGGAFEDAGGDQITFASDVRFLKQLSGTGAGAVIIPEEYDGFDANSVKGAFLRSKNPKRDFFRILGLFHPPKTFEKKISPGTCLGKNLILGRDVTISANVTLGDNVCLGSGVVLMPGVYIGDDAVIGDDTVIKPNAVLMERTVVGRRVLIHPGTVVGSDGFGFTPDQDRHEKLVHAGYVQIDDDVEIGACNTIDRGTFGRTWIKNGVKTDNLVHIAHNVVVGANTLVVAQAGIAGSTEIGSNVILAGRAGVSGHLKVGDGSIVGPGAGVLKDVKPNQIVSGFPSMPHKLWLKVGALIPKLPEMRKRLASLEKKIDQFEKQ